GVAVALVLGVVPRGVGQGDVKAILEKAIKAHGGGEKINKVNCLQTKTKGKLELFGGIDLKQEMSLKFTGKVREVTDKEIGGQKVQVISVFDGNKAAITANGQAVDVNDKIMEEFKEIGYSLRIARLANVLTDKSLQLALLGESKVEDRPALGIKISSKG